MNKQAEAFVNGFVTRCNQHGCNIPTTLYAMEKLAEADPSAVPILAEYIKAAAENDTGAVHAILQELAERPALYSTLLGALGGGGIGAGIGGVLGHTGRGAAIGAGAGGLAGFGLGHEWGNHESPFHRAVREQEIKRYPKESADKEIAGIARLLGVHPSTVGIIRELLVKQMAGGRGALPGQPLPLGGTGGFGPRQGTSAHDPMNARE